MRATRAIIHTENFRHNIRCLQHHTNGGPGICLCVKADAYGHGAVPIALAAQEAGVEWLAIATCDEGAELRDAGIDLPILLLSLPVPDEIETIIKNDISSVVGDEELISRFERAASSLGEKARLHLKIDTGMGRIGCAATDALPLAGRVVSSPHLVLEGICTHFPVADEADRTFTEEQIRLFDACIADIRNAGIDPGIVHAANSGAIVDYPSAWYDMIRPGIIAYGYYPSAEKPRVVPVRPVMELLSQIVFLKKVEAGTPVSYGLTYKTPRATTIGTVAAGYGDGYSRLLSNKAHVLIRGNRYPVAGRVCMDQFMVDLGPESDVQLYDDVVLFGPDGTGMSADDIADITGSISYEVVCGISKRVPRKYADNAAEAD